MSDTRAIQPVATPISGTIRPPGSKSISNRALILAAIAEGESTLRGLLDCEDTRVMVESLRRLGIEIEHDPVANTARVQGCGGKPPARDAELYLENSGTSIRFLTALCALGSGTFLLDGNSRMRERPIGHLVTSLRELGVDLQCVNDNNCPPVLVRADGLPGGATTIDGSISSQYLSALLMAAPCAKSRTEIRVKGALVSEPYIDMTLGVMARFDVAAVEFIGDNHHCLIEPSGYQGTDYDIEPDASAASYFLAAAAMTGGKVTVEGLSKHALQGDVKFVDALRKMGCRVEWKEDSVTVAGKPLHGIEIDMNAISDTAQTLSAVAVFAEGPTRIYNVGHMRHKETDRISAVATELRKLGQFVEETEDSLTIHPAPVLPAIVDTYNDHRMAMSFSLIGLRAEGVTIDNPGCTVKTYPHFFEDLERLCQNGK
jgi:3-phosphoshikimate 1-carboxyvinyltransferase